MWLVEVIARKVAVFWWIFDPQIPTISVEVYWNKKFGNSTFSIIKERYKNGWKVISCLIRIKVQIIVMRNPEHQVKITLKRSNSIYQIVYTINPIKNVIYADFKEFF